ncbi:MAG: tRNA (adenosine(37)-N6)-threonylcarbamoyltransferase complex dimerization subunit type 1 TsaB [Candidatus Sumerlaea chitinivorans]|nr:tRNA (adenosine(37)-N6)-threonylcarbamoyltransferase complex dimerization subunit type 1 TsaB [Candidatus Sumerlaea chitinivorans]
MLLAIESSGICGGVALLEEERLVGCVNFTSSTLHSQRLLPSLEWLLARTGRRIQDVRAVGISKGPGSFTGLRVGMSMAKGIALAQGIPIVGICSLEALALRAAAYTRPKLVCPMLDARQRYVYAALYRIGELQEDGFPHMEVVHEPAALHIKELLPWIQEPTLFTGDGLAAHSDALATTLGDHFHRANVIGLMPSAEQVAVLAARRLRRGETDNIHTLEPFYLRHGYMGKSAKHS